MDVEKKLTRFERARILGARAIQISMGAKPLVDSSNPLSPSRPFSSPLVVPVSGRVLPPHPAPISLPIARRDAVLRQLCTPSYEVVFKQSPDKKTCISPKKTSRKIWKCQIKFVTLQRENQRDKSNPECSFERRFSHGGNVSNVGALSHTEFFVLLYLT